MLIHWIGPYAPVPGRTGADLRSYHLLRELSERKATVKGWFLDSHGDATDELLGERHRLDSNWVSSNVRAGFMRLGGVPLTVGRRYHPGFREAFSGEADLVYVDHLHLSVNVPSGYDGPVWLDEHNLEHRLWEQYARTKNIPLRWGGQWEADVVEAYEINQIRDFTGTALPSRTERKLLPEQLRNKVTVIPNGVSEEWLEFGRDRLREPPASLTTLGFIGEYDWLPNREGTEAFLEDVWLHLRAEHEGIELVLAGKNPPERWSTLPGVSTPGYVDSSRAFFERIDALVVPLTMGAGTRLKVLEAMARGVPLAGTEKGVEGIDVDPACVAEGVTDLGDTLKKMIDDPSRAEESARRHYEHVRNHYRWNDVGETLRKALGEIVR